MSDAVELLGPDGNPIKRMAREVIVRDAAGLILYACIAYVWDRRLQTWVFGETEYTSASCEAAARVAFLSKYIGTRVREVAIAPAIGFFVNDNHGDDLSA